MPIPAATLRKVNEALNNSGLDEHTIRAITASIDAQQGAAVTNSTSTSPTAAPAGGTGTAAGGWDTAVNRDAAIATINANRTLILELQTKLNALLTTLRSSGVIAP